RDPPASPGGRRSLRATRRLEHADDRRRMVDERRRGAAWPRHEFAAAVRTAAAELRFGAGRAEGAFEGADARLGRIRRQVAVTAFAPRSQFEHAANLSFLAS